MSSTATESKAISQNKKILQDVSLQDFLGICQEYNVVSNSVKDILEIAADPITDTKDRIEIHKWLIEMNVGKPGERLPVQEHQDNLSAGIFIDWGDNKN
jgi:hypothetical protein